MWTGAGAVVAAGGALVGIVVLISSFSLKSGFIGPMRGSVLEAGLAAFVLGLEAALYVRTGADALRLIRNYGPAFALWLVCQGLYVLCEIAQRRTATAEVSLLVVQVAAALGSVIGLSGLVWSKVRVTWPAEVLQDVGERARERLTSMAYWPAGLPNLAWLLIPYWVLFYATLDRARLLDLVYFTEVFTHNFLLLGLILLVAAGQTARAFKVERSTAEIGRGVALGWLAGCLLTLVAVLAMFVYVDPHGRFGGERFPPIGPFTRFVKLQSFDALERAPDIVILGSSRAFTLSPDILEGYTGHAAFNLSVEAAIAGDYSTQLRYLLDRTRPPLVLMVEVNGEGLVAGRELNPSMQPVGLLPYVPADMVPRVLSEHLENFFGLRGLSDSLFILRFPDPQILRAWRFGPDGYGTRAPVSPEQYQAALRVENHPWLGLFECESINPSARTELEAFVSLALEHDIGVVFYRSPLNGDFLDQLHARPNQAKIAGCLGLVRDYFASLAERHPNVFFRDLLAYPAVSDLRQSGFYDVGHLKPKASELVLEALLPELRTALEWAEAD